MPFTVYDQMIAAGAPAIKPPFAYYIQADSSRVLRIQVVQVDVSTGVTSSTMLSQRIVDIAATAPENVMNVVAAAAAECWNEVSATIGMDAIVSALTGAHGLQGSRPAAPVPSVEPDVVPADDETDPH